jgi:hypothetical protein
MKQVQLGEQFDLPLKESAQLGETPVFVTTKDILRFLSAEGVDQFLLTIVLSNEWTTEEFSADGPLDFPANNVQITSGDYVLRVLNVDCDALIASIIIENAEPE